MGIARQIRQVLVADKATLSAARAANSCGTDRAHLICQAHQDRIVTERPSEFMAQAMSEDRRAKNLRALESARSRATLLATERDCRAFDVLVGAQPNKDPRALDAAVRRAELEIAQLEKDSGVDDS